MTRGQAGTDGPSRGETDRGRVELRDLARYFDQVAAVDGIDLDVSPGEFVSLLGPSGCGKTTTLRLLAGFEQPDRGTIHVSGLPLAGVPPHKRDVNTVFQAYALFPHMTVAENVAYGLRQRRTGRRALNALVSDALDMVQMAAMADRKPNQLSGGQQQRVALARALVNRPSLLLLDEPLGALDRKLREEMQIELKLLQTELQTTFIFVTHDQEEALAMSDRIAVMRNGRIEQIADPVTVYEHPTTPFVAGFLGQQNFFPGTAVGSGAVVASGSVHLRPDPGSKRLTAGASAVATVRPEAISLAAGTHAPDVNAVSGVLASTAHLGDVVQHVVQLSGDQKLLVRTAPGGGASPMPGEPVVCKWRASSVRTFPIPDEPPLPAPNTSSDPSATLSPPTL